MLYYLSRGPNVAAKFLMDEVPPQFHKQIGELVDRELLKRGITN
jgi:hypothetical protein